MNSRSNRLVFDLHENGPRLVERDRGSELSRMIELAQSGEESLRRDAFSPGHFTASAFVLSPRRDQLLLILHKKLGLWLQPGGHIEIEDETWHAAVRREVAEETGLGQLDAVEDLVDIDIHAIPQIGEHPPHLHFDLRALLVASTTDVRAGDDAARAHWFELEQLAEGEGATLFDGVGTDASVIRVARTALLLGRGSS